MAVSELAGQTPTVWTGCVWAPAHVVQGRHGHSKYRVRSSNGLSVVCDKGQSWPLLHTDRTLGASCTCCLEAGQRLFPYNLPTPSQATQEAPEGAVSSPEGERLAERGRTLARQALKGVEVALAPVLTGISRADFRSFLRGWVGAQRGHILAPRATINALHLKVIEVGCGPCQAIDRSEDSEELFLSRKCAEMLGLETERCVVSRPMPPTVLSVEKVGKSPSYYVALKGGASHSVLVNGFLVLTPQEEQLQVLGSPSASARTALYQVEEAVDSGRSTDSSGSAQPETPPTARNLPPRVAVNA